QLALRQEARRPVHSPHRRHGRRTQSPRGAAAHIGWLQMAWHHLGRGPRNRRAVWAVLSIAARPALSRRGPEADRIGARVSLLHGQGGNRRSQETSGKRKT